MILATFFFLYFVTYYCNLNGANVVINKIYFATPEEKDRNEFIELKLADGNQRTMEHHQLLIIDSCGGTLCSNASEQIQSLDQ